MGILSCFNKVIRKKKVFLRERVKSVDWKVRLHLIFAVDADLLIVRLYLVKVVIFTTLY